MRGKAIWAPIAAVLLVVVGIPASAAAGFSPYREVWLGDGLTGMAFNEHRQVVGAMGVGGYNTHPFLWEDGVVTDLGPAVGAVTFANAVDINEAGWVIGGVSADSHRSYLWRDGVVTDLDTLENTVFSPRAVNERGQVVGSAPLDDGAHAFLWQRGVFTDIGVFDAADVNNRGEVVGDLPVPWSSRAGLWRRGVLVDLGAPGSMSWARMINDQGEVLGVYQDESGHRGSFLWRRGRIVELGTLGGDTTMATGLNDRGQVTGYSETADGAVHPFLWERGRMVDLTTRGVRDWGLELLINNRGDLLFGGSVLYLRG